MIRRQKNEEKMRENKRGKQLIKLIIKSQSDALFMGKNKKGQEILA